MISLSPFLTSHSDCVRDWKNVAMSREQGFESSKNNSIYGHKVSGHFSVELLHKHHSLSHAKLRLTSLSVAGVPLSCFKAPQTLRHQLSCDASLSRTQSKRDAWWMVASLLSVRSFSTVPGGDIRPEIYKNWQHFFDFSMPFLRIHTSEAH
jgi:hypothetical protein